MVGSRTSGPPIRKAGPDQFLEEFGTIRPSSANEPGSSPYAMARRCFRTFKKLWTERTIR